MAKFYQNIRHDNTIVTCKYIILRESRSFAEASYFYIQIPINTEQFGR